MRMDRFLSEQRLLVIAPHADDETIGAGGLMARAKDVGAEVFVQVLTVGDLDHYDGRREHTSGYTRAEELSVAVIPDTVTLDIQRHAGCEGRAGRATSRARSTP